jgi:hypothetical protein
MRDQREIKERSKRDQREIKERKKKGKRGRRREHPLGRAQCIPK